MCTDSSDWAIVALEQYRGARFTAVALPLVDNTLITANYELIDIVCGEGEAGNGNWTSLSVNEFKALLWRREEE